MFKKIPGYPNYSFDWNKNQVRNDTTGKILKIIIIGNQGKPKYHPAINLCNENGCKTFLLGSLTLMILNGEYKGSHRMHTCHNDDNPWNNKPKNVRLDTHRANHRDRTRLGMQKILYV